MIPVKKTAGIILLSLFICIGVSGEENNGTTEKKLSGAEAIELETIFVHAQSGRNEIKKIESKTLLTHKVTDLAEILSDEIIEAQMIRKSGYGNEVSIRGFGQENIKVMIDSGIIEGACGSRKDPALSHINMLTVNNIVVQEGPFDITKPGFLGAYINVMTKKPVSGFSGEILAKAGSNGFTSDGFTASGGNDFIQAMMGYNYSKSGQYEDGNGKSLWEVRNGLGASYNHKGMDSDAFEKHDIWGKISLTPNDSVSVLLEHTYGKAEDILTPRVVFDTKKEINRLSKVSIDIDSKNNMSDNLEISIYRNAIEHYPFQDYRNVPVPKNNEVESIITGGSIENTKETDLADFKYGIDFYHRDWWGDVYNSITGALLNGNLIPSVKSFNTGAFLQADRNTGKWSYGLGIRYDRFSQEAHEPLVFTGTVTGANKQVDGLPGGFLSLRYYYSEELTLFGGIGKSYRTPTAGERYIQGNPGFFGNPLLEPVSNSELDLGLKFRRNNFSFTVKGFYSDLEDFIYQENNSAGYQSYTNIDAHILGGDIKFEIGIRDFLTLNGGAAYQKGHKDSFPDNNFDKDLGQIAPLKTSLSLNFLSRKPLDIENSELDSSIEWIHSENASRIDEEAGEQYLPGWDIVNIKMGLRCMSWNFNFGIDNLFDRFYTVANSYEWDVVGGTGANPAVVNEPGRFIYAALGYRW